MILDKKLHGVLDQQKGILQIYPEPVSDVSEDQASDVVCTNNFILRIPMVQQSKRWSK